MPTAQPASSDPGATAAPAAAADPALYLSVVVPMYNEQDAVGQMHQELSAACARVGRPYELIFVDDGSRDQTLARLEALAAADPAVTVVSLRRNFGQTPAMSAGIDRARGEIIVTLDGDLQNDPAEIPRLLAEIERGFDMVSGWRRKRKDGLFLRRVPSMIANRIISKQTGVGLHDYGCSLKAYRREVIQGLRLYGEMHRFIPAVAAWYGVRLSEIEVNHRPRTTGRTKYGIDRTFRVILDLLLVKFLLSYSTKPIQIFGRYGLLLNALAALTVAGAGAMKLAWGVDMTGNPLLMLGVLLSLVGMQMIGLGILGEMNVRIYYEATGKKIYAVRRVITGTPDAAAHARSTGA